jgi:hypothetical protein
MADVSHSAAAMLRQADEMAANATALRQLANAIGETPEPLGHHVISLAVALHRYGVCLVTREVLEIAKAAIEAHDPDDADHPREAVERQRVALQAIEQSLWPQRWLQQQEADHG